MRDILEKLAHGKISVSDAEKRLKLHAITQLGDSARIDTGREFRKGIPEVVMAEGKDSEDLRRIVQGALRENGEVILSRVTRDQVRILRKNIRGSTRLDFADRARILIVRKNRQPKRANGGRVGIITAGTSDVAVAEEARIIAEEMGCRVLSAYDVGVAGLHRLFEPLREMIEQDVDVLVVVAGREGALPTVVAGLVDVPVIAVPTSMGYGYGEKGQAALAAMLQGCSLGLAVVNIDGGVAAGALAALIANKVAKARAGS